MKKLVLLILLTANILSQPSKSLLDNAIRQSDVELVEDILKFNTLAANEKYIYYQLANDVSSFKRDNALIPKAHPLAILSLLTGMAFTGGAVIFTAITVGITVGFDDTYGKLITGGIAAFDAAIAFLAFRAVYRIQQLPHIDYNNSLTIKQMLLKLNV